MIISKDALNDNGKAWELVGPIAPGGTVFGLAVSPVADVPRYWAATGCGVFMSDDGGETWTQSLTGLTTPLLSSLGVAANGALFAGSLGGDLFNSFDFGRTWQAGLVAPELRAPVTVIVPAPTFRTNGVAYAATDGGGLLVTRSSGGNWEDSSFGLGDGSVLALAISPDWSQRERMFAATTSGVFASSNGGRAWRETSLMPEDDVVDVLAVSPSFEHDHLVLAGTEAGRIYRSTDGGRSWEAVPGGATVDGPVNCLWVVPGDVEAKRVVAGIGSKITLSDDHGATWRCVADMPGSVLALSGEGMVVLAGLHDAGVFRSVDGGATWASVAMGFSARGFAKLTTLGSSFQALGPQEGLWASEGDGASWRRVGSLEASYPLATFASGTDGALFVASQQAGLLRSTDAGATWSQVCEMAGIQALLLIPGQPSGWLGTADGKLLSSRDGGATWKESPPVVEGQEILSLVASPNFGQDQTLFMGTALPPAMDQQPRVALWRSTDGGGTWKQVTSLTTPARWIDIAMPIGTKTNPTEQAIFASGPYCLRPLRRAKDVWISTRVDPNGANTLSVVALGELDEGGLLFAATGTGIYRSIDGGRTWQTYNEGLTSQSFISLVAAPVAVGESDKPCLFALSLGGLLWKRELV